MLELSGCGILKLVYVFSGKNILTVHSNILLVLDG